MKRKQSNIIPMEEMTQDLLNKAYSCGISKKQLLEMFSDCIEKKWMKEEKNFRKKVEIYLRKNQHYIESYEADFYDQRFEYKNAGSSYSNFKSEFDLCQRYKFYLEIICAMYKLHKNMDSAIDMTDLYNLLNEDHLDIDYNKYVEVVEVVCMIFEGEVYTSTQCGEFCELREQYYIYDSFQLTILGMIYLVEKENA